MPKRNRQPIAEFQHSRLHAPRSIRLLTLHPSSDVAAPVVVTLLEASLDNFPSEQHSYEALSYVWGASEGSIPCTCDGKQLFITPNCDDALRHLRLPNEHRNLWVDAICIDQANSDESLAERNTQITLMGGVYRTAKRTLCWIGKSKEYTAGTFERLRQIGSCPSKRELRKLLGYDEQLQQKRKLEAGSTCLNHIFCHSWHSRIWTLQEVAFSGNCQVLCGTETIAWELYFKAARFLIYEEFIDEVDAQALKNYVSIGIRDDIRNSLLGKSSEGEEGRKIELLTSALTQVRHLQATNPKDKIYGLYAVFTALEIPLPAPDYGKVLEQIYEEACLAIIIHSGSLQMLEYASSNTRNQALPSWVADWQDEDVTLVNPPSQATEGSRISQPDLSTLCPATGKLRVRGKIIGLVTTRSENDFATLEFPSGSLPILKEERYDFVGSEVDSLRLLVHRVRLFREWIRLVEGVPPSDIEEDSGDFFHRLVTFDSSSTDARLFNAWMDILQYPDTSYDISHGERVADMWESTDKASACCWTTELSQCSIVAAALSTKNASKRGQAAPETAELLDFTAHISGNMSDRALILVHNDLVNATLPGTAFHTTMVGDSIVLLEGSEHPIVLRQKGNKWLFVGPAFVLGIMDGEAWSDEDGAVNGLQDFVLV